MLMRLAILLTFLLISCSPEKPIPQKAEGVPTVKNDEAAASGEGALTLTFEEDLRISEPDDQSYSWSGESVVLDVDKEGRMFLAVPQENHIIVFSPDGQIEQTIGSKGKGPGQFENLMSFQAIDNGYVGMENLSVSTKITFFNKDFSFRDRINRSTPNMIIQGITYAENGKTAFAHTVQVRGRKLIDRYLILDEGLEPQMELLSCTPTAGINPQRLEDPNYWPEAISERLMKVVKGEFVYGDFAPDGTLYTITANEYRITQWKGTEAVRDIDKTYKPTYFGEDEHNHIAEKMADRLAARLPQASEYITPQLLKKAIDIADFPDAKHPAKNLKITDSGHILVLTGENFTADTVKVDIFTAGDGKYRGTIDAGLEEMESMVFRNGMAYSLVRNADDANELVRYRYTIGPKQDE